MTVMLQLGKLTIDAPFYQAGLAGYSDAAMRLIARRHGAPYCITEAMLDHFLINGGKGLKAAELDDEDHPIAGQLMGSHPADIADAAKVLVRLGYDVIDVNLACPVKKVRKKARGGHLLSVPDEAIAILDAVMQAVGGEVPVTCKLRRAFDDSAESAGNFYRVFEAAMELGLAGATVHSRTVEQKYHGPGWRPFLRDLCQRYALGRFRGAEGPWGRVQKTVEPEVERANPSTPRPLDPLEPSPPSFTLGGSGDVWTALDIFDMLDDTGVDWVSVARGCIGNPWVFTQARRYMATATTDPQADHEQPPRRARFSGRAGPIPPP
ncbi:MAG: tRNA dihydrouridine synthase, partial [Phycisphaeraceae bacterium]